jgi:hypothetical protein
MWQHYTEASSGRLCRYRRGRRSLSGSVWRETLAQFLIRLDQVVEKAITEDIHTDEINPKY